MFHIITIIEYFADIFTGLYNNKQIEFVRFRFSLIYTKINTINQNEWPALIEAELIYLEKLHFYFMHFFSDPHPLKRSQLTLVQ